MHTDENQVNCSLEICCWKGQTYQPHGQTNQKLGPIWIKYLFEKQQRYGYVRLRICGLTKTATTLTTTQTTTFHEPNDTRKQCRNTLHVQYYGETKPFAWTAGHCFLSTWLFLRVVPHYKTKSAHNESHINEPVTETRKTVTWSQGWSTFIQRNNMILVRHWIGICNDDKVPGCFLNLIRLLTLELELLFKMLN